MRRQKLMGFTGLAVALTLVIGGCGKSGPGSTTSPTSRKILNLAANSENYFVLDIKQLVDSGFVEMLKKNFEEEVKQKLDKATAEMGIDPFKAISMIAFWGNAIDDPTKANIAITTDIPSEKIASTLDYISKQKHEEHSPQKAPPNVALLGKFEKKNTVEAMKKTLNVFKEMSEEGGIAFFEAENGACVGIVDGEAVLFSSTQGGVKTLWQSISTAPDSASSILGSNGVLRLNISPKADGLSKITGNVEAVGGGLSIAIDILAQDEKKANQISQMIPMFKGMLGQSEKTDPKFKDLLNKLKVESKGTNITISLNIPKEMLDGGK